MTTAAEQTGTQVDLFLLPPARACLAVCTICGKNCDMVKTVPICPDLTGIIHVFIFARSQILAVANKRAAWVKMGNYACHSTVHTLFCILLWCYSNKAFVNSKPSQHERVMFVKGKHVAVTLFLSLTRKQTDSFLFFCLQEQKIQVQKLSQSHEEPCRVKK